MASSSLPVRKVLITLGQSNSTAIAPAKSFEDVNPRISLRNPLATFDVDLSGPATPLARYYTESAGSRDEIDMGAAFGDLRYVNYRDLGAMSVRYLTFYNPVASSFDSLVPARNPSGTNGSDEAIRKGSYPGVVGVTRVDSATQFATDAVWIHPNADPTLVRLRTNTTHTTDINAAHGVPNDGYATLNSTTSFNPPLEVGERFSFVLTADADSAADPDLPVSSVAPAPTLLNHVRFDVQLGGYADAGSAADPVTAEWGTSVTPLDDTRGSTNPCEITADGVEFNYRRLRVGMRVRFSGTLTSLTSDSAAVTDTMDFFVVRVQQGTALNKPKCWLSRSLNGAETVFAAPTLPFTTAALRIVRRPGEYALAGMQIRCLTGANAGTQRYLSHAIPYKDDTIERLWLCYVTQDWTNTPAAGDTYTILPPNAADGTPVPFDKWAYFLPACQFNGRETGLPSPLTIAWNHTHGHHWVVSQTGVSAANSIYEGCPVRLYENPSPSSGASVGQAYIDKTYYAVHVQDSGHFSLAETYGGQAVNFGNSTLWALMEWADTFVDKYNPAPPGFNYSNLQGRLNAYQPFEGPSVHATPGAGQPTIAYHWGLAQRLSERIGEPVYVIDLSCGGSSLAESVVPRFNLPKGYGWYDPGSMMHWAAGPTALRERWLRHLDAAEIAAAREGVQLEVVGVVFVQGESDAEKQELADRYYANLLGFKDFVRSTIKAKGWWKKDAAELPFLQPEIYPQTDVAVAASVKTVNAAIKRAADEDPFSKSWSVASYTVFDGVHYDGASMNTLAKTAFTHLDGYVNAVDIPLRICKLALSLAGERSGITSVFPSDGSAEANLCAQYYPEARDRILEAHAWDFLVRQTSLTGTTNERKDWRYAYELPHNSSGIIGLGEDIVSAFDTRAVKIKFSVELNSASQRVLYANQAAPLTVRYKAKTADPRHFSASCIQAIAHLLASMIMRTTLKSEEGIKAGEAMEQRALQMFKAAASNDSNQTRDRSQSQQLGWRRS